MATHLYYTSLQARGILSNTTFVQEKHRKIMESYKNKKKWNKLQIKFTYGMPFPGDADYVSLLLFLIL